MTKQLPLLIGDVAEHFGCRAWQVRRLIERGLLPEPQRLGPFRVFFPSDLPRIEQALLATGYVGQEVPA